MQISFGFHLGSHAKASHEFGYSENVLARVHRNSHSCRCGHPATLAPHHPDAFRTDTRYLVVPSFCVQWTRNSTELTSFISITMTYKASYGIIDHLVSSEYCVYCSLHCGACSELGRERCESCICRIDMLLYPNSNLVTAAAGNCFDGLDVLTDRHSVNYGFWPDQY